MTRERLPRNRADISWAAMATVLVQAWPGGLRSESQIAAVWDRQIALVDLLGTAGVKLDDGRLDRGRDRLLPCKE